MRTLSALASSLGTPAGNFSAWRQLKSFKPLTNGPALPTSGLGMIGRPPIRPYGALAPGLEVRAAGHFRQFGDARLSG